MRVHRYYESHQSLEAEFWLNNAEMLFQWRKVMRYREGDSVVLFDGKGTDRLYRLQKLEDNAAQLSMITELEPLKPKRHVTLFWSLLKKDKNDWVLQKATELGASELIPLLAEHTEKTGFDVERAQKIIIEASEQCGRSNLPLVREPQQVQEAVGAYHDRVHLFVCEAGSNNLPDSLNDGEPVGLMIGPEGGWSQTEKQLFEQHSLPHLALSQFVLRAETAAITALSLLRP